MVKKLGSLAGFLDGCRMLPQRRQWNKACAGAGGVTGKSLLIEQKCFGAARQSNIEEE